MTSRAPAGLLAAILGLTGMAICCIDWGPQGSGQQAEQGREFQRLVGGLGLGPAPNLSPCEFQFDPRVFPDWKSDHLPVVCGEYFCPAHASSVFYISLESPEEPSDAGVP